MSFFELLSQSWPRLLQGLGVTLESTLISLVLAAILGLLFGMLSVSRAVGARAVARVYVDIIRGTPIIVQAFFIYFGITSALNFRMEPMTAGIITLTLNDGAYLAEIFRGGIESVDKGQMEAARSLGLSHGVAMRSVILPQAVRTMVPAIVNQCIITLKDSSILSVIGMAELTQIGSLIIADNLESFKVWIIVGVMYFIIIMILSTISKRIEKRLKADA